MDLDFIKVQLSRLRNFFNFAHAYVVKNNPIKLIADELTTQLKDFLTFNKKIKMARYRVNYQRYKLDQMEKIIAQNNEHVFLKGRTLNQTR